MPENKLDIATIFQTALQKETAAERGAYLDEACGDDRQLRERVDELLEAHPDVGSFLETPAVEPGATVLKAVAEAAARRHEGTPDSAAEQGDWQPFLERSDNPQHLGRLGAYEILEVIGRGGMGTVLLIPAWLTHG